MGGGPRISDVKTACLTLRCIAESYDDQTGFTGEGWMEGLSAKLNESKGTWIKWAR